MHSPLIRRVVSPACMPHSGRQPPHLHQPAVRHGGARLLPHLVRQPHAEPDSHHHGGAVVQDQDSLRAASGQRQQRAAGDVGRSIKWARYCYCRYCCCYCPARPVLPESHAV